MEENSDASESDASSSDLDESDPEPNSDSESFPARIKRALRAHAQPFHSISSPAAFSKLGILILFFVAAQTCCFLVPSANADGLDRVRSSGVLRYGSDMEGGGPYAYPDPRSPRDVTGFEVELMAMLCRDLSVNPEFCQGQWDKLLQVLSSGRLHAVINGYEWTENRARAYAATRPYYVYQLQLMVPARLPRSTPGLTSRSPGPMAGAGRLACWSARRVIPMPASKGGQT